MKIFRSTILFTLTVTGLNIIGGWLTARSLGPADRGALAAVLLWPNLLFSLGSFGMFESLVYFVGKDRTGRQETALAGAMVLLGLSLIVTVGALLFVPRTMAHYSRQTQWLGTLYCLTIPLATLSTIGSALLSATLRIPAQNRVRLCGSVVGFVGALLLIATKQASVSHFVLLTLIASVVSLALVWKPFMRFRVRRLPSPTVMQSMLAYGARSYVAVLCVTANARLDQALIAVSLAPSYLGWYVVSVSISAITTLIPATITGIVFPLTVRNTEAETRQGLSVYFWFTLGISAIIAVVTVVACPFLLGFLYGPRFAAAVVPAQVLALGSITLSSGSLLSYTCRALGAPGEAAKSEMLGLVVTLVALPLLLWQWQIIGAAVASLLSYSASLAYLLLAVRRRLGISLKDLLLLTPGSRATFLPNAKFILRKADSYVDAR